MNEGWWRNPEELDEDQQKVVALTLEGNHLVLGPPGSGKTNLLLLRAAFLTRSELKNIAVITFTRVLREFLHTGAEHYPFEPSRIQTYLSWGIAMLKENGISFDSEGTFEDIRQRINEGLGQLVANGGNQVKLDCILIDEVQDYTKREIELMSGLANQVFAVGDDNQRIYQASGSIDLLQEICGDPNELQYHYRNGHAICRLADGVMNKADGGMADSCNYDENKFPSTAVRFAGLSLEEQIQKAASEIETQIDAYPGEWIGVLAPRKVDVTDVYNGLLKTSIGNYVQLQKYEDGYTNLNTAKPVIVTTMHSSKGLEFRAVHLMALDQITKLDHHQKLAYTAITRAKTSLALYHRGPVRGYVERGVTAVSGKSEKKPTLSDLFGAAT